jgi:hypothetical protein
VTQTCGEGFNIERARSQVRARGSSSDSDLWRRIAVPARAPENSRVRKQQWLRLVTKG